MSELDFAVEKTSFIVSVIDAIEEYIKAEFLFDYEEQKENFQYIQGDLNNFELPEIIKNSGVMQEFFRLKSEFRKYIKDKNYTIEDEFFAEIYKKSSISIEEKIVEIDTKIEHIKNDQPENEEKKAWEWNKSNELEQKAIEEVYQKKQDKESIDSYKQLGARVKAVRAKSSIEKMEDHFLVKEKILSAEEMKAIISNRELLNTLASYNYMASANAVTKLFEIARNYY
ncbi:predicted protein [Rickettsia japonica]|uniref:Uncharacterized protein n=1 Tax=Rickettsia japonica TaxID=35790 RepID=A0AAD1CBN5_RICJA|nr:hypothetical protein [Rickettsia japonica]BAW83037.1 predicted protein [Rickettsia japonica]